VDERSLGETLDAFLVKYAAAVENGDLEQVLLADELLRQVVMYGNHAVTAAQSRRNQG
jgi:hypothetical protein